MPVRTFFFLLLVFILGAAACGERDASPHAEGPALQGPIQVKGQEYRGLMVGFDRQLTDEDAAAILTYIRSSWGNEAPPVSPSTIAKVRSQPNPGRPLQASEIEHP